MCILKDVYICMCGNHNIIPAHFFFGNYSIQCRISMGNNIIIEESGKGGIILYQTPDGQSSLEVKLENETVWLTRQQMAMLFGRDVKTIGKHINNALREELAGESVVAKFATPKKYGRREGFEQTQYPEYYSLEMITSVGYRVKSRNGIIFRRWANSVDEISKATGIRRSTLYKHVNLRKENQNNNLNHDRN